MAHEIEILECTCEPGCDRYIWQCSCGERTESGYGWLDEEEAEDAGEAHMQMFSILRPKR